MKKKLLQQIASCLKENKSFLIVTHVNPDGDALGSMLALGRVIGNMGKTVFYYCEGPVPDKYLFLPGVDRIMQTPDEGLKTDVVVIVDSGDIERTGNAAGVISQADKVITIDHHITNNIVCDISLVDSTACASAEIVYDLILEMKQPIEWPVAMNIYTAIISDTGSFRFASTNRAAFRICEQMVECGVNPHEIAEQLYSTYSMERLKLLSLVLDSLEISSNREFALVTATKEMMTRTGTDHADINGIVDYPRFIKGIVFAGLIHEVDSEKFHISLRSKECLDVSQIAKRFGGGGHTNAAGFPYQGKLEVIKNELFRIAEMGHGPWTTDHNGSSSVVH
ncbi:MAG: bifunctional oligoribonuclease/PAP phosphatase NrnA [Pseudomonadota bacterium]